VGQRGPKAVEIERLQRLEHLWWSEFQFLREGTRKAVVDFYERPEGPDKVVYALGMPMPAWMLTPKYRKEILPRRDLWDALLRATSDKSVMGVCKVWENWLKKVQPRIVPFAPQFLASHSRQFRDAKKSRRFPKRRRSADEARFNFLSAAMAGIHAGISPATSVDRLSRVKHDRDSPTHAQTCWRCRALNPGRHLGEIPGYLI
jgi:hypothetical protein